MRNILVHPHHPQELPEMNDSMDGAVGPAEAEELLISPLHWGNGIDWLIFYCNPWRKPIFPRKFQVPVISTVSTWANDVVGNDMSLWSAAQRVNAVQKGICLLHVGVHCRNSAKNWVSRCTSDGAMICLMMVWWSDDLFDDGQIKKGRPLAILKGFAAWVTWVHGYKSSSRQKLFDGHQELRLFSKLTFCPVGSGANCLHWLYAPVLDYWRVTLWVWCVDRFATRV